MVPNNEEGCGSGSDSTSKTKKGKATTSSASKSSVTTVEKDSEEYRKLRERNNEAVKKSRTRTRMRTQSTLDKVEKLRMENTKLEDRIEGLKKELDLLKELFVSHAGTKSMKRLTEVDLDVLLAEAAPNSKKTKKNAVPYTGRRREVIEQEVQALLGALPDDDEEEADGGEEGEVQDEAQPSTSKEAEPMEQGEISEMSAVLEESQQQEETTEDVEQVEQEVTETFTIIDDGSGPTVWTTENGEAVVVTIQEGDDGPVQQDLHDIIQGEILMLE